MLETVTTDVLPALQVMAASDEEDARGIGLLFLLAGPAFYALIYFRYRNSHKRHHHEKETEASTHDMRASDTFVRRLTGLRNRTMRGANHKEVRGALRKIF